MALLDAHACLNEIIGVFYTPGFLATIVEELSLSKEVDLNPQ